MDAPPAGVLRRVPDIGGGTRRLLELQAGDLGDLFPRASEPRASRYRGARRRREDQLGRDAERRWTASSRRHVTRCPFPRWPRRSCAVAGWPKSTRPPPIHPHTARDSRILSTPRLAALEILF